MRHALPLPILLAAALAAAPAAGQEPAQDIPWNALHAEHLLNRAGFGATSAEVAEAVALGREACVDRLIAGPGDTGEELAWHDRELGRHGLPLPIPGDVGPGTRARILEAARFRDLPHFNAYVEWWVDELVAGVDPLRDRMTLFWHGFLATSIRDVRDTNEIVVQHQFLRKNALGPFDVLIRGIARDPAMLEYLDNDINVKEHPNENWARELMELFTLGVDRYTEDDIKEAARAFTGWTDRNHVFHFERRDHDFGQKTVLGVTGRLDGDDVIDIILAREDCGRWLAFRLLEYFEGVDPTEERLADYATFLRESGYDTEAFLRRLFADPAFYRDEVVGTRVSGPLDFLIGTQRRLGVSPTGLLAYAGGDILGQRLFAPPNVKGWEEGLAWINTSSMLHRSNVAGIMLGLVDVAGLLDVQVASEAQMGGSAGAAARLEGMPRQVAIGESLIAPGYEVLLDVQVSGWQPECELATGLAERGATTDAEIVGALAEDLLAAPLPASSREVLARALAAERTALGWAQEAWLVPDTVADPRAEDLVRRLAHLMLSLPEAQLN